MTSSIEAIEPLSVNALRVIDSQQTAAPGFVEAMEAQLEGVNHDIVSAESSLQQLAAGQPVELHDVMISLEKARISVETLIQVRNRMVDAYQELMRMQI